MTTTYCGSYVYPGTASDGSIIGFPGDTTVAQACTSWNSSAYFNRAMGARRQYYNSAPSSIPAPITADIAAGRRVNMSFTPAISGSSSDRSAIGSFLASCKSAGLNANVALWHEPYSQGLSTSQYASMIAYYGPTVRQHYWLWQNNSGYPIASGKITASTYFNACAAGSFDGISYDVYAPSYKIDNSIISKFNTAANSAGVPLGIWEYNGSTTENTNSTITALFDAIKNTFTARLGAGEGCGDILLFDVTKPKESTQNCQFIGSGDFRIALVQAIYDACNGVSTTGPSITTSSLPGGTQASAYSATLTATGGSTPYAWSVSSGSLPSGLSLAGSTGVISGTPTRAGTSSFTAKVTDHVSATDTKPLSVVVASNLAVTTSSLPGATQGASYTTTLAASGGTSPYTWSATTSLPGGLSLSSGGVLSGTPTGSGSASLGFKVTDSVPSTATRTLTLTITASGAGPNITTATLADATQGSGYFAALAATGGTTPYAWSVFSGSLPAGLALATGGTISGTPTVAGSSSFTVQVADAGGLTDTQPLTLTVDSSLSVATATLPDAVENQVYAGLITATGGTPPYSWAQIAGTPPPGISMFSDGSVEGTPTATGTYTFTPQVTDSVGSVASAPLLLTVDSPGPVPPAGFPVVPGPPPSVLAAISYPQPSVTGNHSGWARFSATGNPGLPTLSQEGVWMSQYAVLDAQVAITGPLSVTTIGDGLSVAEGTNAKQGVATLSAGAVTVANTSVTANSRILLTAQDNSSVGVLRVSARTAGTSFTITSSSGTDSGLVAWFISEPA